jgi:hypothetical protein
MKVTSIRRSVARVDVKHEPRGGELDQTEPEVSGIPVGLVRLDVANATIIVLELALNGEVGFIGADKSKSAPGSFVSRDLEIQVTELVGRHACRFELYRVPNSILPSPQHGRSE